MTQTSPHETGVLETADHVLQAALEESPRQPDEPRLKEVIDRLTPSIFVGLLTVDGNLIHANRAALDAIGARLEDVIGMPFETTPWWTFSDVAMRRVRMAIQDAARGTATRSDILVQDLEGRIMTLDFSLQPLHGANGRVEYLIPSACDVTESRAAEQRILHLTNHDDLTGLPNRNLFGERLRQAITNADRHCGRLAVLLVDLDRFSLVNNSLGPSAGDEVLKAAANRLAACASDTDTLARLGGDKFAFVLTGDHADVSRGAGVAQRIADAFNQPVLIAGREVYLTCSIGGVVRIAPNVSESRLLRNAEGALSAAKARGGNVAHFYSLATAPHDAERLDLESALRGALKRNEISLHYQPLVDLRTGAIVAAEALMRWDRPARGMVPPARFIPIAEQTGLIVPLGMWALRSALGSLKRLREQGLRIEHVSVNLSARQLLQPDLVAQVRESLQRAGVEPGALTLELTESMLMEDATSAARTLGDLKALGVKLSLDDFGTGYSSLAYLSRFAFDTIKIDRSFVQAMHSQSNGAAIVDATIRLAHSLGMRVVAEGVESETQLATLASSACDQGQGYFFSRPLPIADLAAMMHERSIEQAQKRLEEVDLDQVLAGNPEIDGVVTGLDSAVQAAVESVTQEAEARDLRIEFRAGSANTAVLVDGSRLEEMAWHVLRNAIKCTPVGGWVRASTTSTATHVEFAVEGSGDGVARELMPYSQDPDRDRDREPPHEIGGVSLGLVIVKQLAEMHGGEVRVESGGEGRGSKFAVTIPRAKQPVAPTGQRRETTPAAGFGQAS